MTIEKGYVESGPFKLRYHIEGKGPAALVLGSSVYYPRIFSSNLRNYLRLAFIEHKGFAPSPGPVNHSLFAMDVLLDDIELFRKKLGLDKVIVIGHSGHAFMALEYAKKYPQYVSHMVMIGSSPDFSNASAQAAEQYWQDSVWPERKEALARNLERIPDKELATLAPDKAWLRNYVRMGPKLWYDFNFDSSTLWDSVDINMQMFDYVWGTLFANIDISKGLEHLDTPVFLALGRYDFDVAPPYTWNPLRSQFKDLTLKVFERSGHTPPYEQPELFDQELLNWLSL